MKKEVFCGVIGAIGGFISTLVGGWTSNMTTLLLFMVIDYIMGMYIAAILHKSTKTESGSLSSAMGFKGLMKKGFMLFVIVIGYRIDLMLNTQYVRNMIVLSFIVNELISITENMGIMGIPLPAILTKSIDALNSKSQKE